MVSKFNILGKLKLCFLGFASAILIAFMLLLFAPLFDPKWSEIWSFLENFYGQYFDLNIYIFIGLTGFGLGASLGIDELPYWTDLQYAWDSIWRMTHAGLFVGLVFSFLAYLISKGSIDVQELIVNTLSALVTPLVIVATLPLIFPPLAGVFIVVFIFYVIRKITR